MTRDARERDRLQRRVRDLEQELEKTKARLARSVSERSSMQLSAQVTQLLISGTILEIDVRFGTNLREV